VFVTDSDDRSKLVPHWEVVAWALYKSLEWEWIQQLSSSNWNLWSMLNLFGLVWISSPPFDFVDMNFLEQVMHDYHKRNVICHLNFAPFSCMISYFGMCNSGQAMCNFPAFQSKLDLFPDDHYVRKIRRDTA